MIYLALTLFLILFEAIPEGFYDRGWKTIAGVLQSVYLIVITLSLFCWITQTTVIDWHYSPYIIKIIIGYLFVRFAIFDIIYNLSRGNSIFHIGRTKLYDRIIGWIMTKFKVQIILYMWVKFILFVMGIAFLLQG